MDNVYYMRVKVGINGLGRIGKCIMLQLLEDADVEVVAINATNIKIEEIEDYLRYDSNHKRDVPEIKIQTKGVFKLGKHTIHLLNDRKAENLNWRKYGCEYVIEATGAFLTQEKCKLHDVENVIMTAPAKDETKTYIYGVNHEDYEMESIISASSCTTNCLAPCLKLLCDKYDISDASFTTIHAATASQYTVDVTKNASRTNRSILNNIIPHTTGASSSISKVIPELSNKIYGTSLRVPVSNCSLVDVNVKVNGDISVQDVANVFEDSEYNGVVTKTTNKKVVSSDFMTTECPCILDINASLNMGDNCVKLMLWYDNEWAYSSQIIRFLKYADKRRKKC